MPVISQLKIVNVIFNSEKYCEVLPTIMIPFGESACSEKCRFQLDNDSIDTSSLMYALLMNVTIIVLGLPRRNTDLNQIKNNEACLLVLFTLCFWQLDSIAGLKEEFELVGTISIFLY